MSLDSALSIATGGLAVVQRQINIVSQNVANASTAGYVREVATQTSLTAGGDPSGVESGPTQRALDGPLQASVLAQGAVVSGLQTTASALSAVDAAQGTPGDSGSSLASLAGGLQTAFVTLRADPSSAPGQQAVVSAAQSLAGGINALAATYTAQRQSAQDAIVQQVSVADQTLSQIGTISDQIVKLRSQGLSTADLENQRDEQVQTLGSLVSVHTSVAADGDMTVMTDNGTVLPTRGSDATLTTRDSTIAPGDSYSATSSSGIAPITLGGIDVTASLTGGSIGANIALRDTTLPTYQAELDEYSHTLATQFSGNGLALFTMAGAPVPAASTAPVPPATTLAVQAPYVGLAGTLQVSQAVVTQAGLVQTGTGTPPAAGGGGGDTTEIDAVLNNTFSSGVSSATVGLGPLGNLDAPYNGSGGLVSMAATLVASQSGDSAAATASLATETGVQTTLAAQFSTASGVSVDQELSNMVELQNAYGAGGKIISSVQAMFTDLLNAVDPS